jgi:hypothetical protein
LESFSFIRERFSCVIARRMSLTYFTRKELFIGHLVEEVVVGCQVGLVVVANGASIIIEQQAGALSLPQ